MFRVRIAPLPDGLHTDEARPTADDLGLDPGTFSDIAVALRLDVAARRVLVAFDVAATAHLVCDRTAEPFERRVEGAHAVVAVPTDAPLAAAADEEVVALPDDATHLDLTQAVFDTLMLALPLRRVHPDFEDADIPTTFGGPSPGEPADDRWDALAGLRPPDGPSLS